MKVSEMQRKENTSRNMESLGQLDLDGILFLNLRTRNYEVEDGKEYHRQ